MISLAKRAVLYIAAQSAPFALAWLLATPLDRLIAEILMRLLGPHGQRVATKRKTLAVHPT